MPELYELVNTYHPDYVWSDGVPSDSGNSSYWNAPEFIAWLYNERYGMCVISQRSESPSDCGPVVDVKLNETEN